MSAFVISGQVPLSGEICAGGSKNAALPVILATVSTRGISVIENVPDISDVKTALSLIEALGALTSFNGSTLTVDTRRLAYRPPDASLTGTIRASTYLIGACLAAFGKAELSLFGGCNFAPRPIDLHVYAAEMLGACVTEDFIYMKRPHGAKIHFPKISVGATANALILASSIPEETEIYSYAREPHIRTLADFLISAGAKIEFSKDKITVVGASLGGGKVTVPPDPIETGTYLLLSLLMEGRVSVRGSSSEELSGLITPLTRAGAEIKEENGSLSLFGELKERISLVAAPYPALPTDLQPLCAPVLGAFLGGSIRDTVFEGRFGYLDMLRKFGLDFERKNDGVEIFPSKYTCASADAPDLRGGATLLLPALLAKGESLISSSELIKRGYGDIIGKLRSLGAEIYEIK